MVFSVWMGIIGKGRSNSDGIIDENNIKEILQYIIQVWQEEKRVKTGGEDSRDGENNNIMWHVTLRLSPTSQLSCPQWQTLHKRRTFLILRPWLVHNYYSLPPTPVRNRASFILCVGELTGNMPVIKHAWSDVCVCSCVCVQTHVCINSFQLHF